MKTDTPLTDAAVARIGDEPLELYTKFHKLADEMGDIERQLTACRSALEAVHGYMQGSYIYDHGEVGKTGKSCGLIVQESLAALQSVKEAQP